MRSCSLLVARLLPLASVWLLTGALACGGTSGWSVSAAQRVREQAARAASGNGDPDATVADGRPVLYAAVEIGDCDSAEKLLIAGADPGATWRGWTPLQAAAHSASGSCVDLLLSHGADPNLCVRGAPPIFLASRRGDAETIRALLAHGARVADTYSRTLPIQAAAIQGSADAVRALIEGGADPNARGIGGESPLHLAAARGHDDAAAVLIEAGARLTEIPSDPWTTARTYQVASGYRFQRGDEAAADHLADIACEYFPQAVDALAREGEARRDELAIAEEAAAECERRAGAQGTPPPLWRPRPAPL